MGNQEKIDKYCNLLKQIANREWGYDKDLNIEQVITTIINSNLDYLLTESFIYSMTSLYEPCNWEKIINGLMDNCSRLMICKESFEYLLWNDEDFMFRTNYEKSIFDKYSDYLTPRFIDRTNLYSLEFELVSEILSIIATYLIINKKDASCYNFYADKLCNNLDNLIDDMQLQGINITDIVRNNLCYEEEGTDESYKNFISYIISKIEDDKTKEIR